MSQDQETETLHHTRTITSLTREIYHLRMAIVRLIDNEDTAAEALIKQANDEKDLRLSGAIYGT